MKKIIVHHRSSHHAHYSGYARLIDFLEQPDVIHGETRLPYRLAKWLGEMSTLKAGLYDSQSVQKEVELFFRLKKSSIKEKTIVHYLNGERDIRYLLKNKNKNKQLKFCATFHKPPEVLRKIIKETSYLKKLDGVICVGQNQVDFLRNWLDLEHVSYIPHGVDTRFFHPLNKKKLSKNMLFVGQHLRDFEMLNTTLPIILAEDKNASIDIILKKEYKEKIKLPNSNRIRIHSGIGDNQLKTFYQKATFLYLPLLDSTACNSILEALACGLPVLTSNVGGNQAYLNCGGGFLLSDKDEFSQLALELLKDSDRCDLLSKEARLQALKYDWGNIAADIISFYKKIT